MLLDWLIAWSYLEKRLLKLSKDIFKDFHASFLKRAEGDVEFVCTDGVALGELVMKAETTGERVEMPFQVEAFVRPGTEPVAKFSLTLSLKKKTK